MKTKKQVSISLTSYMVCGDCFFPIATGDYSSLDYYYEEQAQIKKAQIDKGIDELVSTGDYLTAGEGANEVKFSTDSCDCCKTKLAGSRHEVIVVKHETEAPA